MDDLPFRVVAIDGRTWTVREVETETQEWALADRCLVCEDGAVVRRFWVYPDDWRSISADELAAFCMFARPTIALKPRDTFDADMRFQHPERLDHAEPLELPPSALNAERLRKDPELGD